MALEEVKYGWIMSNALELKMNSIVVGTVGLVYTTAATMRTYLLTVAQVLKMNCTRVPSDIILFIILDFLRCLLIYLCPFMYKPVDSFQQQLNSRMNNTDAS